MDLTRISRKWGKVTLTATDADGEPITVTGADFAVLPYKATPSGSTTWTPANTFAAGEPDEEGVPTWVAEVLLAGPDASSTGALVAPAGASDLWARVVDTQEVDPVMVGHIRVQ